MSDFKIRGIEIHSRSMWYHAHVNRVLSFMENNGFNALIFHQSDILNNLVLPSKYISKELMWNKFRGMRTFHIENNQNYLNLFIGKAKGKNIKFYLSIKEIYFPDEVLELFPFLVKENSIACPTDPFWIDYIEACMEDLCLALPELSGVILSAGTHEARTSITKKNPCGCQRCKKTKAFDWYYSIFNIIGKVLGKYGKEYIIRDFSNSSSNQSTLLQAAKEADPSVIISLKNTPHDYFPTFPDNPKIGTTGQREWIEFDAWGQFYASGIFPASIAEDFQDRMKRFKELGAEGVYFRTDWEGMYENSAFSSSNILNLYAAGLLAEDVNADLDDAYKKWAANGWLMTFTTDSDNAPPYPPKSPEAWKNLKDYMKASWQVLRKTVYVRTHWFCEDNMFPDSLSMAYRMMVSYHGRDQWDPGASEMVKPTEENISLIMKEKEEALAECRNLRRILNVESLGFPSKVENDINEMLDLYDIYCHIGFYSAGTVFYTWLFMESRKEGDKENALKAIDALLSYRETVIKRLQKNNGEYTHIIYWLLNEKRMLSLALNAKEKIEEVLQ